MGAWRGPMRLVAVAAALGRAWALPPFVVLSEARSGTTWLLSLLNQHPKVRAKSEILYTAKDSAEVDAKLEAFARAAKRTPRNVATGFKFFDGEGGEHLDGRRMDRGISAWLSRQNARVVVLERQGLARFVSAQKHSQAVRNSADILETGLIERKSENFKCETTDCVDRARKRRIWINATTVVDRLDRESDRWSSIIAWTRRYRFADVQYHAYSDLSRDPFCEMKRIFAFLGVPHLRRAEMGNTTLKMGSATPRLDIANADAVEAALRGSRWEGELDRRFG